jgi:hypothetical protein
MLDDPAKRVTDHVVIAIELLTQSLPRTQALRDRLIRFEQDELRRHNPIYALYGLPPIMRELGQLTAPRPGVDDAITQLGQAVDILNRA